MLWARMRERGYNQTTLEEAASKAGFVLRQSYISQIIRGVIKEPRDDKIAIFNALLGLTKQDFYRANGALDSIAGEMAAARDVEARIWQAIWSNRTLARELRRALRHESDEEVQHLLDRSFALAAKSLEIDLDRLERRNGPVGAGALN
jgi:transcriptional regulator with XRE-family HTH domain